MYLSCACDDYINDLSFFLRILQLIMSQHLTLSIRYYNTKFVERFLIWVHNNTGLSFIEPNGGAAAAVTTAASISAVALLSTIIWRYSLSSNNKIMPYAGIPTPKGNYPYFGIYSFL